METQMAIANGRRKLEAQPKRLRDVVERLPCEVVPTAHSLAYLQTKKRKMGHALSVEISDPGHVARGIEAQL
jgi:hypothetical protein